MRKQEPLRLPVLQREETARANKAPAQVAIAGTFDVSNFGDLLFPLLAEFELKKRLKRLELTRYSYRQMDEKGWSYKVNSLSQLPQNIPESDLLIIGGGHLIRFDKLVAPGYYPTDPQLHHPTGYWLMPTLLGIASGVPVAWNCVGVSSDTPCWARRLLSLAVQHASYVSVRDNQSARELHDAAPQSRVQVVPDTAFGIRALLSEGPSPNLQKFFAATGLARPYVIVQASPQLQAYKPQILATLNEARSRGCQVLELPISPALGDVTGLETGQDASILPKAWPEPLLIAELIANAEAVIAQSLHLSIVALACGVPVHRPRCGDASKYGHIEEMQGVHLWDPGTDAVQLLRQGLGRREPGVRVKEILAQLSVHWDKIAELAGQKRQPNPSIIAATLNACVSAAEEAGNVVEQHATQNGGLSNGDQGQSNTQLQAVDGLNHRIGALENKLEALASKNREVQEKLQSVETESRERLERQEAYFDLIARVRNIVRETLPAHSTVLVVNNGDNQFISFGSHTGWHFPRTDSGIYAGRHPTDSTEAIAELNKARFKGAQYLLFPITSFWWFDSYPEFIAHLKAHFRMVLNREDTCRIFSLRERS